MDLIITNVSKKAELNFGNTSMMLSVIMSQEVFLRITVFPEEKTISHLIIIIEDTI